MEQALDPRTRLVLFKMLNRGLFSAIHGCVSTGKEANVYYAVNPEVNGADFAIKVYKTSVLVFKDRDRCASEPCLSVLVRTPTNIRLRLAFYFACTDQHSVEIGDFHV